jgi:hypothetical protein
MNDVEAVAPRVGAWKEKGLSIPYDIPCREMRDPRPKMINTTRNA